MDLLERKLSNSICFVMIYMKFFDNTIDVCWYCSASTLLSKNVVNF